MQSSLRMKKGECLRRPKMLTRVKYLKRERHSPYRITSLEFTLTLCGLKKVDLVI